MQSRRGREAAARTDAGVLRLLRLALVGARPLAAGAPRAACSPTRPSPRAPAPALARSLTAEHIAVEARYLAGPGRDELRAALRPGVAAAARCRAARVERPAGAAVGRGARARSKTAAAARLKEWLPKLSRPIRIGEHDQTAFAFGLVLDWARAAGDQPMIDLHLVEDRRSSTATTAPARCTTSRTARTSSRPASPRRTSCAACSRRRRMRDWLRAFLPQIPADGSAALARAGRGDRPDRPEAGASRRPEPQPRVDARRHRQRAAGERRRAARRFRPPRTGTATAGLKAVTGEHYEGGHWLGSFAVYLSRPGPLCRRSGCRRRGRGAVIWGRPAARVDERDTMFARAERRPGAPAYVEVLRPPP